MSNAVAGRSVVSSPPTKLLPSPPLPDPLSQPTRQPLLSHAHNIHHTPSIPSSPVSQQNSIAIASRNGLSRAEAYASAHQPRRSKEGLVHGPVVLDKGKQKAVLGHGKEQNDSRPAGPQASAHVAGGGSKPIFDWISRKLGAGRRASIAEPTPSATAGSNNARNSSTVRVSGNDQRNGKYTSLPRKVRTSGAETPAPPVPLRPNPNRAGPSIISRPGQQATKSNVPSQPNPSNRLSAPLTSPANLRPRLSPTTVFPQTPGRDSVLSPSESHSMHAYSVLSGSPTEKERRREANNPYPSMPLHMYKGSIMSSSASAWASASGLGERSVSFRTRSRTPSVRSGRSISSSLRPRISISRDGQSVSESKENDSFRSSRIGREGETVVLDEEYDDDGMRTPIGADENASIRPLPPSHPPSPTPSQSILSRSASGSLLSPGLRRPRSVTYPYRPPPGGLPSSSSTSVENSISERYDDDEPDALSRRDSASTKPTTIVSFDSGPGVAHIAQVAVPPLAIAPPQAVDYAAPTTNATAGPSTPTGETHRTAQSTPNTGSPVSTHIPQSPLRASLSHDNSLPSQSSHASPEYSQQYQAQPPRHSHPHPIHNPRPSSPPNDNASILTLASSTFAAPQPNYANSIHRPSSISRYSMISNYTTGAASVYPPGNTSTGPVQGQVGASSGQGGVVGLAGPPTGPRPGFGTSPSVTFAPIRNSDHESGPSNPQARPTSLAPSHLSHEQPSDTSRRPPSLASPLPAGEKEYPPSLHPTMGTRGSASLWHGGRVDEEASTRAMRRRGSDNSVGSFESRWSWRGAAGGGSVSPVVALGRRVSEAVGDGSVSRNGSLVR